MKSTSRRSFIKASALLPFVFNDAVLKLNKANPLLSFSTLGCPKWTFKEIVDFAARHQYKGIEIRGIQGQLDLTQCAEFSTPEKLKETGKMVQEKGLKIINLGASTELHHSDTAIRQKNLDQGRQFIDLAMELECPYVRVFPNHLPESEERNKVMDLIITGLKELGNYAKKGNVTVLLETHGTVVKINDLKKIMQATENDNSGLIWDVVNMWSVTKEPPKQVYEELKKYIRHVHLKDIKFRGDKFNYVLFADGEAPVFEAINALHKGGYKGYYSFEWEKLWHPEIEEPEIALADFPRKMTKLFNSL